ncbi:MAG: DNA gyrase subunit A [Legionellales bacterium]|nr:DNA gyrase subunit A [Legionellales bacterium]
MFEDKDNQVLIEDELKSAYLDYAMSVIVGRALPDVRDGLKPVHRRSLYAMQVMGNDWNKPHKKSARVVGDTIGKYHPHGDAAVYDAIVRMAQPFSMAEPLVDGQGNFGSVDGDSAASMRYTEVRLTKLAHQLLSDLEKDTVDFVPNYDNSEMMPSVLPTRVPNLLLNGSTGIAVGMATNIPPHNLSELIDAVILRINQPDCTLDDLMSVLRGPDFPTAGIISGAGGIRDAYETGKGRILLKSLVEIEESEKGSKQSIIVKELPYQVNKARLVEKIGHLVRDKKIEHIVGLRDESDRIGMRVVIEVKRGENAQVVLNNLMKQTQLQVNYHINMVALIGGVPQCMGVMTILDAFLSHRREVVTRRSMHDLNKAKSRAHIVEGLLVSIKNIEAVIELIKSSSSPQEAKQLLMQSTWEAGHIVFVKENAALLRNDSLGPDRGFLDDGYHLSEYQAQAILDLKLQRLTALEQDKLLDEYHSLIAKILDLKDIIENHVRLMAVIKSEFEDVKQSFSTPRRTEIVKTHLEMTNEDLIDDIEVLVTLSCQSYIKSQALANYSAQKRGGKGKKVGDMKDEDIISRFTVARKHDSLLLFTNEGRVFWQKVYELPFGSRTSRGRPLVNYLPLGNGEVVTAMIPVSLALNSDKQLIMATRNGVIKKTGLSHFSRPRTAGVYAISLDNGDSLIDVKLSGENDNVVLFSSMGKAVRFMSSTLRSIGRTARGVKGIKLANDDFVVSMIVSSRSKSIVLTASENGYGKRTSLSGFRLTERGGSGVISMKVSQRNGRVIGAVEAEDDADIFLITGAGVVIRIHSSDVSLIGRNTQGVNLIGLSSEQRLISIYPVIMNDDE